MGRKLFEAAQVDKEFVSPPAAGHNDLIDINPGFVFGRIHAFME